MYQIIWSESAKKDYWQNIDYLLENWSETVAKNFMEEVERYLFVIRKNPKTFLQTEYRNVHAVPVVSQITLFYRITDNKIIELIRFWNNYQDPSKLRL